MSDILGVNPTDLEAERQRVEALLETWQATRHLGPDEWQPVAEEAHQHARALGDPVLEAHSLIALAFARVVRLECPPAIELAHRAIVLLEGHDQPDLTARAHQVLGRAHYDLGDDETALQAFERALEHARDEALRLHLQGNVAAISIELGRLREAIEAHERLLANPQTKNRANTHSNLATALFRLGVQRQTADLEAEAKSLFGRADQELRQALGLARAEGQHDVEAHVLVTLGDLSALRGDTTRALEQFQEAIRLAEGAGFAWPELQARINLGGLEVQCGQHQEAISILRVALERAEALGFNEHASRIHRHLADAQEALGNHREALTHHRRFHELDASVKSEAASRRVEVLAVRFQVERARLEAQLERERAEALSVLNEALERQALTDPLTGLANRRAFSEHYQRMFAAALEAGSALTVVLLDLDHFKGINDRFSHVVGDEVLKAFAQVLLEHCRVTDLAARYGGEEFAVLLPGLSGRAAFEACERLRLATEGFDWAGVQPGLRVTASFGFCDEVGLRDYRRLLEMADQHLYAAKREGRNRVRPAPA